MTVPRPDRRDFLHASGSLLGGAWLAAYVPDIEAARAWARVAVRDALPLAVLTPREARELGAVAEQIIPADDTPGALDAGVVAFIDRALETFAAPMLGGVRAGLAELTEAVRRAHPEAAAFSDLPFEQATEVLRGMERTPFFGMMRFLTVAGMFSDPSHGGNREGAGWALLGFEPAGAFVPPFGAYDADLLRSGGEGGGR